MKQVKVKRINEKGERCLCQKENGLLIVYEIVKFSTSISS